jgi:hypothetical protein
VAPAALLAPTLLLAQVLPAGAVTGTTDPTVRAGYHSSPIAVPGGTLTTMVSLPLSAGSWFVTAKAVLAGLATSAGHYGVTCQLVAGDDFDTVSAAPLASGVEGSYVPVWLTAVHHFDANGNAPDCAASPRRLGRSTFARPS